MSEILIEWLNKEVKLSKQINNLDEDFSTGYLIGELLNKYKQITNFKEYKNRNDEESVFHNFKLVEKALRDMEIKVESRRMKEISEKRHGVAARFLYQIKMKLAKKEINFEGLLLKKSNQLHQVYSQMKYPNENRKYLQDAMNRKSSPGYEAIKAQSMSPAKLAGIVKLPEIKQNKFESFQFKQELKIIDEHQKEAEFFRSEHMKNLNKIMEKEKAFHKDNLEKDQKGLESWNKNMSLKKDFEKKQHQNDMKEADFFKNIVLESFKNSARENEIQIDTFDKNLSRLGLDIATIDPKLKKNSKAQMSSEMVMQKIKEKMNMKAAAKKEKDRRNRMISVEQTKAQQEIEKRKREELFKSQYLGNSNINLDPFASAHQKRLDYENWRNMHERVEKFRFRHESMVEEMNKNKKFEDLFDPKLKEFDRERFLDSLKHENLKFRVKELEHKKLKKERDHQLCSVMFDLIFDITEETFDYQKNNKTDLIDVKEWKNWMQMFIDGKSVNKEINYFETEREGDNEIARLGSVVSLSGGLNSQNNLNNLNNINPKPIATSSLHRQTTKYRNQNITKNISDMDLSSLGHLQNNNNFDCEESEFMDYLNFKGQWMASIIPEDALNIELKIYDILGSDFFSQSNGSKGKMSYRNYSDSRKDDYELKDEERENLTIPKANTRNLNLGEIIDIITDLKLNSNRDPEVLKSVYSHIPIKVSLIGHAFAGKKTQAKLLIEGNTHIKVYNIEELIKKTIETLEKLETPIEAHPKFKTFKKPQIEQMEKEKAAEEEKFKEMKKIITPIRESISNSEFPNDELIVNLLLEYIKQDFPEKDPNQVVEDILKKHRRKKEIMEELAKIKEEQAKKPKAKVKEEQQLNNELTKMSVDSNKGFILVDFPQNVEQAKILENKLTEYVQEIDKVKTHLQEVKDNFALILDKSIKQPGNKQLKQGGLDLLITIDVPSQECIRRAVGRRIDPNTGNIYHIEDNPAPPNDHKLNDRLQIIDDPNASEARLQYRHMEFDNNLQNIIDFYDPFGFHRYNLRYYNLVSGFQPKDQVTAQLNEYLLKLQKINEDRENELLEKEKSVFNVNSELSHLDNNNTLNPLIRKDTSDRSPELYSQVNPLDEEDFNKYFKKLEESKKKLSTNLIETLYFEWNKLFENYITECKMIFKFSKRQNELILSNFSKLQVKFIEFLKRPSKKMEEVQKYQMKYNKFADDYPELKDDPQVKQEFHQDVVDLSDRIWEIIDLRKVEAIEERRKIMASGWIENEMEKFYNTLERLFVNEVEKFLVSLNIIRDYYNALDSKNIALFELGLGVNLTNLIKSNEILTDLSNLPLEGENKLKFPRIDKIYKNCVKLIFKYEEKIAALEKSLKISSNNHAPIVDSNIHKKFSKSMTYKRNLHTDSTFLDERRDIFLYEEEMKNTLKNEKMKFKYRVTLLKHWGSEKLSNMRRIANLVYDKLDEWIISTIKAENEAMNTLVERLNSMIEREMKVKVDLEMDGFDIYNVTDISQYIDNLPTPLPTKVVHEKGIFHLNKFKLIVDELKSYEVQKNYIRISTFIEVYLKKYLIESNNQGIPESLRMLSFHNFNKLIKFFEFNPGVNSNMNAVNNSLSQQLTSNSDFLNVKNISLILALIHCKILDDEGEKNIRRQAENYLINNTIIAKENFLHNIEFWFEKDFSSSINFEDEEYAEDKPKVLKQMIFDIYKDENVS